MCDRCRTPTALPSSFNTAHLWNGDRPPGYAARGYDEAYVRSRLEMTRRGDYVDSHVWVLTPDSLVEQLHELRKLGLIEWYVDRLVPTAPNELEFRERLRRIPRGADLRADIPDEVPLPPRHARLAARRARHSRGARQGRARRGPAPARADAERAAPGAPRCVRLGSCGDSYVVRPPSRRAPSRPALPGCRRCRRAR
ncbi:hypothetical protein [Nocardioides sp. InS609-2]|uniref:hypothetical protein n=1 Tax=Nocardioides sp. InS609-2 TaxID=2760705 RepID=UPI0020BF3D1B|nr:hypothetical protein [Nocardioides sp. InS609-2]